MATAPESFLRYTVENQAGIERIYKAYKELDIAARVDALVKPCALCSIGEHARDHMEAYASTRKMKAGEAKDRLKLVSIDNVRRIIARRLPIIYEMALDEIKREPYPKDMTIGGLPTAAKFLHHLDIAEVAAIDEYDVATAIPKYDATHPDAFFNHHGGKGLTTLGILANNLVDEIRYDH